MRVRKRVGERARKARDPDRKKTRACSSVNDAGREKGRRTRREGGDSGAEHERKQTPVGHDHENILAQTQALKRGHTHYDTGTQL